jgi:uncharacterized membrane protein
MVNWQRLLKNLLASEWSARRALPRPARHAIRDAIRESEKLHLGELEFVMEHALPALSLLRGHSPRDRAIELFSRLRVWDTEHNAGVLIYVLLAERGVEIVADRGIHAKAGDEAWHAICRAMQARFREGRMEQGAIEGVRAVTEILKLHFPAGDAPNANELRDSPVVL